MTSHWKEHDHYDNDGVRKTMTPGKREREREENDEQRPKVVRRPTPRRFYTIVNETDPDFPHVVAAFPTLESRDAFLAALKSYRVRLDENIGVDPADLVPGTVSKIDKRMFGGYAYDVATRDGEEVAYFNTRWPYFNPAFANPPARNNTASYAAAYSTFDPSVRITYATQN